ncbi:alpha/beta hydrolase [Nocardioides anomalus]|uniref:alpha/beta hydrolase n=1 Tax=Nocardioides anomalus TaxID=2712223 RepID=UPI001E3DFE4F|nr:alpha/beta hydrolase [Nocardioides anomalus]
MTTTSGPETIRYGDDPSQYVELTRPEGASRGTVVVIHGGFWRAAYDLDLGRPLARDLATRGWTVVNTEYRRVGNGGGVPQTLDDVRAAIAAVELGAGPVVTLGHSAGGHLATWAGSAVEAVTHVISQAGVVDLVAADAEGLGDGAVRAFLGEAPIDATVDPVQQVPLGVPVWCVHGTADEIVPISQSQSYVAAATAAGAQAELVEVAGDHFVVIDTASTAWARTVDLLEQLS